MAEPAGALELQHSEGVYSDCGAGLIETLIKYPTNEPTPEYQAICVILIRTTDFEKLKFLHRLFNLAQLYLAAPHTVYIFRMINARSIEQERPSISINSRTLATKSEFITINILSSQLTIYTLTVRTTAYTTITPKSEPQDITIRYWLKRPVLHLEDDRAGFEGTKSVPCACGDIEGAYGTGGRNFI